MKSLRGLRYIIIGCLVSFLIYLYFSYEWRAAETPPPSFDLQAGTSITIGSQIVSKNLTLKSQRAIGYETGRTVFEDFLLKVDKGGKLFTVSGKSAEVKQKEEIEVVVMKGSIRLESSDGLVLTGEGLTYIAQESLVRSDSPVSFSRENIKGEARQLTYELESDILNLRGAVRISIAPSEERKGEPPVTIGSDYLRYDRKRDFVWLRNNVLITRPPDYVKTKELIAFFDPIDKQLSKMELWGGVLSRFGAAEPEEAAETEDSSPEEETRRVSYQTAFSGGKTLFCRRMKVIFHPEGENRIDTILAYKSARLEIIPSHSSYPTMEEVRTVTANRFEFGFAHDGREIETFDAFDNVHARLFLPPTVGPSSPPKDIYCEELHMKLDPRKEEVVSAKFKENVRYVSGEVQIVCEEGDYNPGEELVTLSGSPMITEGQDKVTAEEVTLRLQEDTMVAKGKVVSQFVSKGSKGGSLGGELFALSEGESPVVFNSSTMVFDKNRGIITFSEGVKAFQGTNIIWADKIVIHQEEGLLKAEGGVKSVLPQKAASQEGGEEAFSGGLLEITSAAMVYHKPNGPIRYFNTVTVNKNGLSIKADKLDLILDPKGEELVEAVAQGGVKVYQGTKGAEGDKGVYDFKEEKLTLTGEEVRFVEEGVVSYTGNILTIFLKDDKMILTARKDERVESIHKPPTEKK
ncbi:hypothetical protein CEE39_02655 [bacterium (candidate division B38) B3_B38]|nr:MAG: hypothetical protein CEE39_02655 [bacterium (candidate division B38) B3_B38]